MRKRECRYIGWNQLHFYIKKNVFGLLQKRRHLIQVILFSWGKKITWYHLWKLWKRTDGGGWPGPGWALSSSRARRRSHFLLLPKAQLPDPSVRRSAARARRHGRAGPAGGATPPSRGGESSHMAPAGGAGLWGAAGQGLRVRDSEGSAGRGSGAGNDGGTKPTGSGRQSASWARAGLRAARIPPWAARLRRAGQLLLDIEIDILPENLVKKKKGVGGWGGVVRGKFKNQKGRSTSDGKKGLSCSLLAL